MPYQTKKLGEILEIIRNGKSCKQTSDKIGNKITRIETISFGEINEVKVGYFHLTNEEKIKYQIDKGDILFSHINSVEHIGKIAIAKKNYLNLFHGMNLLLLRGNKKDISDEYLYIILQFYFKSGYWAKICNKAINQASLNQKNIIDIDIPLPPLQTQKLIVQKLDLSFEKIDKSIELTKKNLQNLEQLNKSILEEIFRENGFQIKKLKDIVTLIMGQSPKSETYNREGIGLPFFQGKKEFGDISPIPEVYCASPIKIAEKGDILISVRAPVGPTNLCKETSCIGRGLGAIRPNLDLIELKYLLQYFKKFEVEIAGLGKGSTFSSITKGNLENLKIPLPPLPKQKEIVIYLDQVFEKNKILKQKYKEQLKNFEEMKQILLKEAFEGRLVKE